MDDKFEYVIIGGGVAGLSMSALLENEKRKHLLLESHSLLGGCASYFKRAGYSFDVGATTLSGLKENRPLFNFLKKVDLKLETIQIDPGVISKWDQLTIRHFSDEHKLILEFQNQFKSLPPANIENFITDMRELEKQSYAAVNLNSVPLRCMTSFFKLLKFENLNYLKLFPLFNMSFSNYIEKFNLSDPNFKRIFDELLLITSQNVSNDTPALFGIMGANYPSDTHYHIGGMEGFILKLKSKSGAIKTNHQVLKISKKNKLFQIETNKGKFYSQKIISTLPKTNNYLLLNKRVETNVQNNELKESAFTLYFTVPNLIKLESLYFQIHCLSLPYSKTDSYFVSFSHPKDELRNISLRQTVTISTHISSSLFQNLSKDDYQKIKQELAETILTHFCSTFHLNRSDIMHLEIGTPKTFERYTCRYLGNVGGIGHALSRKTINGIFQNEIEENFFEIGDTTFPGQGISAVILGALNLMNYLHRSTH